jgi:hypothetical protein
MMLVSLEEARHNLFIDYSTPEQDADLTLKIKGASNMIKGYLRTWKATWQPVLDEDGEPIIDSQGLPTYELDSQGAHVIRDEVKSATLLLVGVLFRDRDGTNSKDWEQGYLPFSVTACIYHLRDPALA